LNEVRPEVLAKASVVSFSKLMMPLLTTILYYSWDSASIVVFTYFGA